MGEECEQLLMRMELLSQDASIDLQPDTKVYNAAIHAWSRYRRTIKSKSLFSGKINSFQQGVSLLNKMKRLDQHQQPDKISYSSVIHSLANHGIVEEVGVIAARNGGMKSSQLLFYERGYVYAAG